MKDKFYLDTLTADNLGIGLFKYSLSPNEKFLAVNSTFVRMLGYSSMGEFKKLKFDDIFFSSDDKDNFIRALRKESKVKFLEVLFKEKKGTTTWVVITASLHTTGAKKNHIEGIIEDITKHKDTEAKLALERDFLQGLLDNIPDAVYFKDRHNHLIKVNKFYADGVGMKCYELIGKTDFDFFPEDQAKKMFEDDNKVLTTGKPIVGKIERTILPNGSWNQVITTKIPMYDVRGKIIGTMGITRDMTSYANLEKERLDMLANALAVLGRVLQIKDPYTFYHDRNVAKISEIIAKHLGWDENRMLGVKLAGELHDLGKISIPLDILNKPGKLTEHEYKLIKEHVAKCYELIKDIKFPFDLWEMISQHHERLDGSGYPKGLSGKQIVTEARILAVGDVLESMTSLRPYRKPLGLDMALEELNSGRDTKYDAEIVRVVFELVKKADGKAFWLE